MCSQYGLSVASCRVLTAVITAAIPVHNRGRSGLNRHHGQFVVYDGYGEPSNAAIREGSCFLHSCLIIATNALINHFLR